MSAPQDTGRPADFERLARELYAAALANVSAATQAQLHQRRRRALAGDDDRTVAWPRKPMAWAGGLLALGLLVLLPALLLPSRLHPTDRAPDRMSGTVPAAADVPAIDGTEAGVAPLAEDPELYLWLASRDAIALAAE